MAALLRLILVSCLVVGLSLPLEAFFYPPTVIVVKKYGYGGDYGGGYGLGRPYGYYRPYGLRGPYYGGGWGGGYGIGFYKGAYFG